MATMEKEYNLKVSLEKERFRKMFKERQMIVVKQLNQLANEVSFELDVSFHILFIFEEKETPEPNLYAI